MLRNLLLIFLLTASLSTAAQNNPYRDKFPQIDRYVDSLLKQWNIPGLALAIVYKDQLIYGKGYGYRNLEKGLPVTTTTLFPIASNTKLFTTTVACELAEEEKLSLDKPVKNYLPAINFSTDELSAKVTLRDLFSHRTGLPAYNGLWINSPYSRNETVNKISYMKPTLGFREGYTYNNMMYVAGGAILEQVTNKSWEDNIRERIFKPLQMNASCFTDTETKSYGNYALAYFEPDSSTKLLPKVFRAQSEAMGPAGSIKSTVEDMSRWMIAQINGGKYKNKQVIPAKAIAETLIPQTIADKEGKYDELSNSLSCMGRFIQSYKGHKITSHTGSIDGFYSNLTFIPKDSLGIFIVYNAVPAGSLRPVISLPVIDILLGLSYTPWSQRYRKDYIDSKLKQKKAADSIKLTQVKNTSPSHSPASYAGMYTHPAYGDIKIEVQKDSLIIKFRSLALQLHHFHYDQFITKEEGSDNPDFRLNFLTNNKGEIDRISTQPFGDPLTEFVRKQ